MTFPFTIVTAHNQFMEIIIAIITALVQRARSFFFLSNIMGKQAMGKRVSGHQINTKIIYFTPRDEIEPNCHTEFTCIAVNSVSEGNYLHPGGRPTYGLLTYYPAA